MCVSSLSSIEIYLQGCKFILLLFFLLKANLKQELDVHREALFTEEHMAESNHLLLPLYDQISHPNLENKVVYLL